MSIDDTLAADPLTSVNGWRRRVSLALMAASGFAGLGYQIVWTQQCALWLGHEAAAVLAVIAAFFGGLALGASLTGPRIERSIHPLRWYAACEAIIALWSLAMLWLMHPFSGWMLELTGVQPAPAWQWTVAFCGVFILLLPATAAMGATLPAMEKLTAGVDVQGRSIAALYAANTFGAVLGVLAAAFWLVPAFGLIHTAMVCIGLNLLCAAVAPVLLPRNCGIPKLNAVELRSRSASQCRRMWAESTAIKGCRPTTAEIRNPLPGGEGRNSTTSSPSALSVRRGVLVRLALTGFLGIGYEVLVVRVLSQVSEDTVYTYALLLAVYLVGTALGAAACQRWLARPSNPDALIDRLLCVQAVACLLGSASLWASERLKMALLEGFGPGMAAALCAEAVLALASFGLPTLAMGALFSSLSARASLAGASFGRSLGVNTFGAAAAPVFFGVLMAPMFGPKSALLFVGLGYLALAARGAWRSPFAWAPAALALAMAVWAPPLAFVDVPEDGRIVNYREGVMAAVSVVEDADGIARLRINNRQQEGSSATLLVDGRQALLPVLLHSGPRRALFLGLGTGVTASTAAEAPNLQVDAVELLPEVIGASEYFMRMLDDGTPNPRLHLIAADARRYVRASRELYDVIVSDNFHPARSGSGSLYTVEHFQAVRARLAGGGLFCQWLPLHQLDLDTLRSIVQSFIAVYPGGWAMLASNSLETPVLGLVGQGEEVRFNVETLRARLAGSSFPKSPAEFGIEDELALLGNFVAGPKALVRFAGTAAPNTDDHPLVAYGAPRITYAPDSLPRDRLIELLHEFSIAPAELIADPSDPAWPHRMASYWAARDRFIETGRGVRPSANVRDMLAQVREQLLDVLRISPDFRPAYDPLLRMAASLGRTDVDAARALLTELAQIQPARPEAGQALHQLASAIR